MIIYLKVKPNQRFDGVEKVGNDPASEGTGWQIRLKAPATDGKANEHLVEYLSQVLGIAKSKIVLKKGHTARIKGLEIDLDEALVTSRLNNASISKK